MEIKFIKGKFLRFDLCGNALGTIFLMLVRNCSHIYIRYHKSLKPKGPKL